MLLRTSSRSLVPSSLISSSLTSTQSHTSYHSSPLRSLTLLPFTLCIYILITLLCSNVITPVTAQAPFLVSSVNSFNVASYGDASVSSFRTVLSSSSTGVNGFILVNNVQFVSRKANITHMRCLLVDTYSIFIRLELIDLISLVLFSFSCLLVWSHNPPENCCLLFNLWLASRYLFTTASRWW